MSNRTAASLAVSIRELPAVHVAYIECPVHMGRGDFSQKIRECFQRVQAWVRELGYDPHTLLHVGVINMVNGQLLGYECCVQVPEQVQSGAEGVGIQGLPGGRYAVVSIKKDPAIIGDAISRFYQEYVPEQHIQMDGARPTYEIYYESTMEYCVPVA